MTSSGRSIDLPGASHNAPIPAGARVGNILCSSAIAGKDPVTGQLPEDMARQVRHAFANLRALLEAGGATLSDVVKLCVTIRDNAVRDAINAEWLTAFPDPHDRPARHITVVPLQHGMWLQLEVMAVIR
ncbi:RidA family protein [Variovorax sp. YR216]|uniref:RidA family protein n=1 Tax=Variovorax sp. YR216 TaxID=1882828 RepID=UPI00089D4158|nr:RidA family protein [Variovorax sp. YR216]SEB24849.1 2-iminobutanoate/2-iminopropanoate deaminase [Variovorax sp. YR216]